MKIEITGRMLRFKQIGFESRFELGRVSFTDVRWKEFQSFGAEWLKALTIQGGMMARSAEGLLWVSGVVEDLE